MPRADLIAAKIEHITGQIADLWRNRTVVARVGGATVTDLGLEIEFQRARLAELEWAASSTDEEIRTRIDALHERMGPEARAAKYGVAKGLPRPLVLLIAQVELLEIALGTHPWAPRPEVKHG